MVLTRASLESLEEKISKDSDNLRGNKNSLTNNLKRFLRRGLFAAALTFAPYDVKAVDEGFVQAKEKCNIETRCLHGGDCPEGWSCITVDYENFDEARCYNPKCDYCGADSNYNPWEFTTPGLTFHVDECLNKACFVHDSCYDRKCIEDCVWDRPATFCDNWLSDACFDSRNGCPRPFQNDSDSNFVCNMVNLLNTSSYPDCLSECDNADCNLICSSIYATYKKYPAYCYFDFIDNECKDGNVCNNSVPWTHECVTPSPLPTNTPTKTPLGSTRTPMITATKTPYPLTVTKTPMRTKTPTPTRTFTPTPAMIFEVSNVTGAPGERVTFNVNIDYSDDSFKVRYIESWLWFVLPTNDPSAFFYKNCSKSPMYSEDNYEFILHDLCKSSKNCNLQIITYTHPMDEFTKAPNFVSGGLYSCELDIPSDTPAGVYPIYCFPKEIYDIEGRVESVKGNIIVEGEPLPTRTPTKIPIHSNPTWDEAIIHINSSVGAPGEVVRVNSLLDIMERSADDLLGEVQFGIPMGINYIENKIYYPSESLSFEGCYLSSQYSGPLTFRTDESCSNLERKCIINSISNETDKNSNNIYHPGQFYFCDFKISDNALPGDYNLTCSDPSIKSKVDYPKTIFCNSGKITVVERKTPTPLATKTPSPIYTKTPALGSGDCDGNGKVTINELITSINISMDKNMLHLCPLSDSNGDGEVTVNEIIGHVGRALKD